jgi:uncharacterized protein (TIGR03435 family)
MRKIVLGSLLAAAALAQTAPAPQFEVASIKPAPDLLTLIKSGKAPHMGIRIDAARVDAGFMDLTDLICVAYKVKPYQVTGPEWIKEGRFDVIARIPAGVSKDLVPEMMQSLLAERFKLKVHCETKDHSAYALLAAKGGFKLKKSGPDEPAAVSGTASVDTGNGTASYKRDSKG